MLIEIFSDVICPWCFIGRRRLARALESRPGLDPVIRWRAFQLNPGMPAEGMTREDYSGSSSNKTAGSCRMARATDRRFCIP